MLKGVIALSATAASGHSAAKGQTVSETVIDVDRQLNRAIMAHDVAVASALYDDDFVLTVSGGGTKRKADMLSDIANDQVALVVCETIDVQVRARGTAAVLTGTLLQAGTVRGRPYNVKLRVTDTWVLQDGRWLLLAAHASPAA